MKTYFTSESVTCGHPDKVCDQIADAVLDDILANDPDAHVACEVTACTGEVHLMGEITSSYVPDYEAIARKVIAEIGYTVPVVGFDAENVRIRVSIHTQSPDIARGVDRGAPEEAGAGDQGMMFGYACCETGALMPLPITLANRLTRKLEQVRREKLLPYLLPDGKAQVSVEYEDGKPKRISAVVVSAQHSAEVGIDALRDAILEQVIFPVLPPELLDEHTEYFINPTGRFVVGGPAGDSGLTGRKIIADTYGGMARHGGGAFSGKDPSKVDRTGAYMARYLAKNIVAAELADRCEIELAYAIGLADSCGVMVSLTEQSSEINQGVARLDREKESAASREERYEAQGAGDQGVMFGYACDETDVLMPLPIYLAHRLAHRLTEVRKSGEVTHLRPDGKTQVTIEYDDDDRPVRLDTVLVSTQHDPEVDQAWLKEQLIEHVIRPVLDDVLADRVTHDEYRVLVNPTGSFVLGGPAPSAPQTPWQARCTAAA